MNKWIIVFTLVLAFNAHANSIARQFFRVVPLSEAHRVLGVATESQLPAEKLDVLVWNIKKTEERGWKEEFTSLSQGKELVLMQEAYGNGLMNTTLEELIGMQWDMGVSFEMRRANNRPTGVMIGAVTVPNYVMVEHTRDRELAVNTPKATLYAKYPLQLSSESLLVITVHGINITSFGAFKRHMAQMEKVISEHNGPVIWAGDFNTRTKGRTRHLEAMVERLQFKTVTFKNGERRMVFKFTKNYLDHAFVRGLDVSDAEVIPTTKGSDHKPLLFSVSLAH